MKNKPKVGDRFIVWVRPDGGDISYYKNDSCSIRLSLEIIKVNDNGICTILLDGTNCANSRWVHKDGFGRSYHIIDSKLDFAEIESADTYCEYCHG